MFKMSLRESNMFNSFDEAVDEINNYYQEEFLNTSLPIGTGCQFSNYSFEKFGPVKWSV